MPKFLENKLKAEYGQSSSIPYKVMNAIGAMRGNKITAKGREMEKKHEAKMEKAPFHHTVITHHDGGKHTVEHFPHSKSAGKSGAFTEHGKPTSYSADDGESLMGKLHEHLKIDGPEEELEEHEVKA